MRVFHGKVRQGLSFDEALQQAQVALIRGESPAAAHPNAWAGFRLIGDWQ